MTGARLVVADDSVLLREGLVGLLERQGFEVVAQEGRADALVQCVRELAAGGALPDAVITDVRMPPGMSNDGLRAALDLKTEFPALGMLVEEGKLEWDAPVIRYLPQFAMYDPFVTREITIKDLLVHRSGLGLGAGDLLEVRPHIEVPAAGLAAVCHDTRGAGDELPVRHHRHLHGAGRTV